MKRRLLLMIIILIVSIYFVCTFEFIKTKQDPYSGIAGSVLAAIFAAFLAWVAWVEWGKLSKTSSADFIHRLTNDFFSSEARILLGLIECGALEFKESQNIPDEALSQDGITMTQAYFQVNDNILKKSHLPQQLLANLFKKEFYSTWDIDYALLNPLEDVGMLERKGILDFKMVYSAFSYYLNSVMENEHIRKYLKYMNDNNTFDSSADNVYYGHALYITKKCNEYDSLPSGVCKYWWMIKREFLGIEPN